MRLKLNSKILLLITLGVTCTLMFIFENNLDFNTGNISKDNLDNKNLKISKISGKIYINGSLDWVDIKNAGNCTGSGTDSDPYIIKDLIIDGGGVGNCIWIEDSDVFFIIENCTFYNSGIDLINAGIKLYNVENGQILNNNLYDNKFGVYAEYIDHCSIIGNNFNNYGGIKLKYTNNNLIYLNNLDNDLNLFYLESNNRYFSQQKIKYIYNEHSYTSYLGNYWNSYEGVDNSNNGIGESPIIFYDSVDEYEYVDRYPLINTNENYEIIGVAEEIIPGYNLYLLLSMICFISLVILKNTKTIRKFK